MYLRFLSSVLMVLYCKVTYMPTMAERIKRARESAGYETPTALSKAVKVNREAVLQWEGGTTKNLKGDVLLRLAKVLDVRPEWILHGTGQMKSTQGVAVSKEEMQMLNAFRNLHSKSVKQHIIDCVEMISKVPPLIQLVMFKDVSSVDQERINKILEDAQKKSREHRRSA